uniref:NDP-hexose 3-ketoreductase n=1 Tax=uncultured bacterium BAC-AB1442/1414/561 TaxID=1562172 RepID=A0A0C4S6H3_9BACT|nr:NDP-hexose 3-ketoreductase [uncultured bacterium BAC-AB1442/1414/561]
MTAVRLGLLGCADIATRRVLPAVHRTADLELVAVASRTGSKAEATAARFGGEAVHGYQRLLERADVDAVYIPLPSALHAEWITRALDAGKHVLAEKPLTTGHLETVRILALARSCGLVVQENYMFLQHRQHRHVQRLIEDGVLGEVRSFAATFAIPRRPPGDIRLNPALGGGALLDVGGYPLRALQHFLGPDLEVVGAALRPDPTAGVDLGGAALLTRADGVTAHLTFGLDHGYVASYQIIGAAGSIRVDHAFTPAADHLPDVWLRLRGGTERLALPADDQYAHSVARFRAAVRAAAPPDPAIAAQARLLDAVRRAAYGDPSGCSTETRRRT